MYAHCHECGWEQDDFYSIDGYNPAKFLSSLNDNLFGDLEKIVHCEEYKNGKPLRPDITTREWIARHYEEFARRIRGMKWITVEQFYADPNKTCPKCGASLDLD